MEGGCIFSCLISAIGYRSEQSKNFEEFIRMEVEAEAREGRLLLGQVFESRKLERGRRSAEIQKDDVVAVVSMVKSRSQRRRSYLQEKS